MATRGFEHVTPAEMTRLMAQKQPRGAQVTRTKYGAVKTTTDGIAFDSAKEARRYQELLNLSRVGQIRELRVQPHYTLFALTLDRPDLHDCNGGSVSARRQPVCEYVADFEYLVAEVGSSVVTWHPVVEDVKSVVTRKKEVYRLKRKLFEAQYGIQIVET